MRCFDSDALSEAHRCTESHALRCLLVQAASKGGNKENRLKVARAKGEKRAKRTSKASAADGMIDLVVSMQLLLVCCSTLCPRQP